MSRRPRARPLAAGADAGPCPLWADYAASSSHFAHTPAVPEFRGSGGPPEGCRGVCPRPAGRGWRASACPAGGRAWPSACRVRAFSGPRPSKRRCPTCGPSASMPRAAASALGRERPPRAWARQRRFPCRPRPPGRGSPPSGGQGRYRRLRSMPSFRVRLEGRAGAFLALAPRPRTSQRGHRRAIAVSIARREGCAARVCLSVSRRAWGKIISWHDVKTDSHEAMKKKHLTIGNRFSPPRFGKHQMGGYRSPVCGAWRGSRQTCGFAHRRGSVRGGARVSSPAPFAHDGGKGAVASVRIWLESHGVKP